MLIVPQNSALERSLGQRLQALRREIASAAVAGGRNVESVTLVAVSKGQPVEAIRAAAALGVTDFGESYLQEALPKLESLRELDLVWHFIGRIQANKTRSIAEHFDWVHGVDRLKIAQRLAAQRPYHARPLQLCLQVNLAADRAKGGVEPGDAVALAREVMSLPRIRLRGLMCILPDGRPATENRRSFAALRSLLEQINASRAAAAPVLDTLSMGMSGDFREAVAEGATLVRIGTAAFGPRTPEAVSDIEAAEPHTAFGLPAPHDSKLG